MKIKIITLITLLAVASAAYFFIRHETASVSAATPSTGTDKAKTNLDADSPLKSDPIRDTPLKSAPLTEQEEADLSDLLRPQDKELLAKGYVLTAEEKTKLYRKKRQIDFLPTDDERRIMADTPVEFYGQVLDQYDKPVIGAEIRCSWPYMGQYDTPKLMQSSTPDGTFEVSGFKASAILISVNPPEGYDQYVTDYKDIQIAKAPDRILQNEDYKKMSPKLRDQMLPVHGATEAYKGDKSKPVIFRLKKL